VSILSPYFSQCVVEGRTPRFDRTEPLLIGFSVKNRAFDRGFFQSALSLAKDCFASLDVVIVDTPYAYNAAAKRGNASPTEAELQMASKVGDERLRMVQRSFAGLVSSAFPLRYWRWWQLRDEPTIERLRQEMKYAYEANASFHSAIRQYSVLWSTGAEESEAENYSNFLLEEFPVFVALYYGNGLLTDLYPGPNFTFFRRLEEGEWKDELPESSLLASRRMLSFLNVGGVTATI